MSRVFGPHPSIEQVEPDGRVLDLPGFQLQNGVSELDLGQWPRIEEALESYRLFRSLREQGAVPDGVRFQVSLPFTSSAITGAFRSRHSADYRVIEDSPSGNEATRSPKFRAPSRKPSSDESTGRLPTNNKLLETRDAIHSSKARSPRHSTEPGGSAIRHHPAIGHRAAQCDA